MLGIDSSGVWFAGCFFKKSQFETLKLRHAFTRIDFVVLLLVVCSRFFTERGHSSSRRATELAHLGLHSSW